ncbi:MAG: hypothetical protein ABI553_03895 [Chloroflexota bacterium]
MIGLNPKRPIWNRSTTLDDPKPNPTPPSPPGARGHRTPPPGLFAQVGATRDAAIALARAHLDLAKAEASSIAYEVGRIAAFGALAVALVIFAFVIAILGTALFTGEWLLGSIGWGVLHGVLLFLALAVVAVLLAIGIPIRRIGGALLAALVVVVLVAVLLAMNLPNRLYAGIGDSAVAAVDPSYRPLVVGVIVGAVVGLLAGIVIAVVTVSSAAARAAVIVALVVAGMLIGAFTAITFGVQVAAGIAITLGYLVWIAILGIDVARTGIEVERLKERFYPSQTIDTTKETLEWLQKRMPPGIGS